MGWFAAPEFKVGVLVVGVGTLIALMSMQVSDDPSYLQKSRKAWFLLPNANGLVKNSAVRSAGIPVGVIKGITLQDGQARVDISMKADVPLYKSAGVEVRANGILGDKFVEIYPGSPTDPELEDGGQILTAREKGSLDNLVGEVSDMAKDLKEITKNLREAVMNDGTNKHILGRIAQNIEKVTGDLAQMTAENKEDIREIVDQVHNVTTTLDDLVNDESEKGFKKTWKNAMVRIDASLKNIEEITAKVNKGEGTIGKLINDESTAEELHTAIEGVSSLLDTANKVSTGFDFHADYLSDIKATKSVVGIQIQPGLDRYYYLGIVDDPAGVVERSKTEVRTNGVLTEYEDKKTYFNKTKFTALFAKNFFDFTVKGGLIENAGGFGVDYNFFYNRGRLSVETFDFANLNLRASITYKLGYGLYASGGVQDALNKSDKRSAFVGAGLYLTNDDLKLLLTKAPF